MTKKVIQIRKEALFKGALYLIPVFIVSGVLAVDLYINVQRWRYDYLTIQAKKNITRWVKNEMDFNTSRKSQNINKKEKENTPLIEHSNKQSNEKESKTFFSKLVNKMLFFGETEEHKQTQEEQNIQKEEDINYGLQAMMAEIEALKVEKAKLENLQNLTRLGYQLGLVSPRPEQVVRITYSKNERDRLIQTASPNMPFPHKPKKVNISPPEIRYAEEEKGIKQNVFKLLNKAVDSVQEKLLNELTTPVNAESKNNLQEAQQENDTINKEKSKENLQKEKKEFVDIDSLEEFLIEKL